jgi:hypothetical protein
MLMKQYEAEAMGADLVYVDGRPSHYMARASEPQSTRPRALVRSGERR